MGAEFQLDPIPDPADGYPTVGLLFIARELGRRHDYGVNRQIAYVTLLIDELGFPPPLPRLVTGKGDAPDRLETAVAKDSQWRRAPVEAWLDDQLPPGNAAQLEARALQAAAHEMDSAAGNLRLVGGLEA